MIKTNANQMHAIFGTGDICIAPMMGADGEHQLGLCAQTPREIGSTGKYLKGDMVDLYEFPILLEFDKPECIDVLIRALQAVKEQFTEV